MKKINLSFVLLFFIIFCHSQKIIEVKYDPKKKTLVKPTNIKSLQYKQVYNLSILGLNSAIFKTDIVVKPFIISSKTPEIVKVFFPSISESADVNLGAMVPHNKTSKIDSLNWVKLEEIFMVSKKKFNQLNKLKNDSDKLYKETINNVDTIKASVLFDKIKTNFGVATGGISKLNNKVLLNKNYIVKSSEYYKSMIGKFGIASEILLNKYSQLSNMSDIVSKENYLKFTKFIENSTKAVGKTNPKKIISLNDGVDINITLINTYTKDTVYKNVIQYYQRGNFSFDFTSGFFYTNKIENSYFIKKRDSLTNNVLKEDNRNFDISFGALGHFSYKFTNSFKAGISMGAALSPFDGKTRYLIGSSAIFGKKKQIALNIGLSLVKIKTLSKIVEEDAIGLYVESSVTTVPVYDKLKSGFYFGISYNLTAKKKYQK